MDTTETLKELLKLAHESLDSKDKQIAELGFKTCTLDLTKGHLTQCEAALESRDELNETLNAKIAELEKYRHSFAIYITELARLAVFKNFLYNNPIYKTAERLLEIRDLEKQSLALSNAHKVIVENKMLCSAREYIDFRALELLEMSQALKEQEV
jgi:hypothetical protein